MWFDLLGNRLTIRDKLSALIEYPENTIPNRANIYLPPTTHCFADDYEAIVFDYASVARFRKDLFTKEVIDGFINMLCCLDNVGLIKQSDHIDSIPNTAEIVTTCV